MENQSRCPWAQTSELMQTYHDQEWGKLNLNEDYLYEMMVLESFQAGLSWEIVLKKRAAFRQAFANFEVAKVAEFTETDIVNLLQNPGIIRHRGKIEAAINNAQILVAWHQQGQTLGALLTELIPVPIINYPATMADVPSQTPVAQTVAKALKKAGFKFMGPVTTYSYLQAIGLVNDHLVSCQFKEGAK
ncbi:MAG: DNA-3-methyladenine glycosylase I [Limosilactobacillus sp.]|nr:DNA-3-methyladenine glycosylase I [Limosilactobacillus sp.]